MLFFYTFIAYKYRKINSMLSNKVKNALNEQIQKEAYASNAYLTLATWCEEKALDGIAEYFYDASNDERTHMLEVYKYLNTYGGSAHLKPLKDTTVKLKNIMDVFKYVFDLEHEVTVSVNKLAKLAYEENDFATFKFLEAFVLEQQQSEKGVNELIDMIKRVGYDEKSLYYLNKTFKKNMALKAAGEADKAKADAGE
jgi:ferritin